MEREDEYREVENLVREAFWNVYRPGCSEHYVIHVLRGDPAFVKELDFVMELDGKLIGQNMFMKTVIDADDGRVIPVLTMGPIGITPELKRRGTAISCWTIHSGKRRIWASARCCSRATSVFTATAVLPMPAISASAITICPRAQTIPSSCAAS